MDTNNNNMLSKCTWMDSVTLILIVRVYSSQSRSQKSWMCKGEKEKC